MILGLILGFEVDFGVDFGVPEVLMNPKPTFDDWMPLLRL